MHRIYGVRVGASATPDELVARSAPERLDASMQLLREDLAGDLEAEAIARRGRGRELADLEGADSPGAVF